MESASGFASLDRFQKKSATRCNLSQQTYFFFNQPEANPSQSWLGLPALRLLIGYYINSSVVIDKMELGIGSYDLSSWTLLLNDRSDSVPSWQFSQASVAGCFGRNSLWGYECRQKCCHAITRRSSGIKEFREQVVVSALKEVSHRSCSGRLLDGGLLEPVSKFTQHS